MPPLSSIEPGHIALCLHRFSAVSATRIESLRALLSPQELARNSSFRHAEHRNRDAVCRGLLREHLAALLNCPAATISISVNDNGKPRLSAGQPGLQFNYSHSGEYVVFAFCVDSPIGVDIERTSRRNNAAGIAQHFFATDEVRALEALPQSRQKQQFFRYWTLKEAYLKARGKGIFLGLDKFSFALHPDDETDISITFCDAEFDRPEHWQFHSLVPLPDYRVSVAVRHPPPHFSVALHR